MNETYVDMVVIVSIHCLDNKYCVQNGRMSGWRANLCVFSYADEKECLYYKRGVALFSALITLAFLEELNVGTLPLCVLYGCMCLLFIKVSKQSKRELDVKLEARGTYMYFRVMALG